MDQEHIDALAAKFVLQPERFDVVVGSNLFGDILSDLAAAVAGSIGIAPSANLDPTKEYPSMFEPVHGSAPDIAGQGIANPVGRGVVGGDDARPSRACRRGGRCAGGDGVDAGEAGDPDGRPRRQRVDRRSDRGAGRAIGLQGFPVVASPERQATVVIALISRDCSSELASWPRRRRSDATVPATHGGVAMSSEAGMPNTARWVALRHSSGTSDAVRSACWPGWCPSH